MDTSRMCLCRLLAAVMVITLAKADSVPISNNEAPSLRQNGINIECLAISGSTADDDWCEDNCFHDPPYCPETHCQCYRRTAFRCVVKYIPSTSHTNVDWFCPINCFTNNGGVACEKYCTCSFNGKVCTAEGVSEPEEQEQWDLVCNIQCNLPDDSLCPSTCSCVQYSESRPYSTG